jgi:predicted phosphodiesterase
MENCNSTRIGVMSDIHGNLDALKDSIEVLRDRGIDKTSIYVCGDIVGYGYQPNECCKLVQDLGLIVVAGNHDYAVAGHTEWKNWSTYAEEGVRRTLDVIEERHKSWLRALPLTYYAEGFEMVHATLDLPEEFFYPIIGRSFEPWQDVRKTFDLMEEPVCFVGHSHIPAIFLEKEKNRIKAIDPSQPIYFLDGKRAVIDVGSIGCPRRSSKKASLVIYDKEKQSIEYVRFKTKTLNI